MSSLWYESMTSSSDKPHAFVPLRVHSCGLWSIFHPPLLCSGIELAVPLHLLGTTLFTIPGDSWLFGTVLPWRVNWPILREFIAPWCPLGMIVDRIEFLWCSKYGPKLHNISFGKKFRCSKCMSVAIVANGLIAR